MLERLKALLTRLKPLFSTFGFTKRVKEKVSTGPAVKTNSSSVKTSGRRPNKRTN